MRSRLAARSGICSLTATKEGFSLRNYPHKGIMMNENCVIKKIIAEKIDPNDLAIEALHASSVRLMTQFASCPSANGAYGVVKMLEALATHQDAHRSATGVSVYEQALHVWRGLFHRYLHEAESVVPARTLSE